MDNKKIIENKIVSDVRNLLSEHELGNLTKELLLNYVSSILQDTELDSRIIVKVLEQFGELGKYEALCIKINEGW